MPAFYSWIKTNNEQTKKHLSYGGETLCGNTIPDRHEYNVYSSGDVCIRCQRGYLKELKEIRGDEWRDFVDMSMIPDLTI